MCESQVPNFKNHDLKHLGNSFAHNQLAGTISHFDVGSSLTFVCPAGLQMLSAGGLFTLESISLECKPDGTFQTPGIWPECKTGAQNYSMGLSDNIIIKIETILNIV